MTLWSVLILNVIIAGSVCAAEESLPQDEEEALEIEYRRFLESL